MNKKEPWMKFYPSDWRGDPRLRMCSIGARGLWMEMMCIMHEATPYGHLMVGSVPVTNRQLASLAGIPPADCLKFMAELESAGVYSRTDDSKIIYSRRMVRDRAKSEEGRAHIQKRWADDRPKPTSTPTRDPIRSPTGTPITSEARSQKDDGGETRAKLVSDEAQRVADALAAACGFADPKNCPLGWYGAASWVQRCLTEGWPSEVMITAAQATALRKRDGPIEHFKYLEKPLAKAVAEHARPLPKIEFTEPQTIKVSANGYRTGNQRQTGHDAILAAAARKARELDRNDDMAGAARAPGFTVGDGVDDAGPQGNSDQARSDQRDRHGVNPDNQRIRQGEIISPDQDVAGEAGFRVVV